MPQKLHLTITYDKDKTSPQAQATLNSMEKSGTLSTVIIPSLTVPQIIFRNFIIGMARGLGFFIGGTVIIGILAWIIQSVVSMNIPYLTGIFKQVLTIIKTT